MADIDWPADLPADMEIRGFNEEMETGAIRTDMDSGPDFVRPRYSLLTTKLTGVIYLSVAQRVSLRTFYKSTTIMGTQKFNKPHPVTGDEVEFRFLAPPAVRAIGGEEFEATLSLEFFE